MRTFLFSVLILLSVNKAHSKAKRFMICLGSEEEHIHKQKIGGAYYRINQEVIAALIQLRSTIDMREQYVDMLCNKNVRYPSVKFVEFMLLHPHHVLYSTNGEDKVSLKAIDEANIKELESKMVHLFVDFVNLIQAQLPKPNCLQKIIPELKPFFEKMRYILEDVGPERVLKALKDPKIVFEKLQKIDMNKPGC